MGAVYLDIKKAFDRVPHKTETEIRMWTERENIRMDARLFER